MKNEKLLICVPTKGRVGTITKETYSWLMYVDKFEYRLFVEPQEFEYYKQIIPERFLVNIGKNNQGLKYSKLFLEQYAQNAGFEYIFKIDDDVKSFTFYETWGNPEFKGLSNENKKKEIARLFEINVENCVHILDNNEEIGYICFPHSSDLFNKEEMLKKGKLNSFMGSIFIFRTGLAVSQRFWKDMEYDINKAHSCVGDFDDVVTFLSVLDEGFNALKYYQMIFSNVEMGANEGGHQSFNRVEKYRDSTQKLCELFPLMEKTIFKGWDVPKFINHIKGMSIKQDENIKQSLERYKKKNSQKLKQFFE